MNNWFLCVCALTVVASCAAQQYQQFVNKYDNFNADSIIQNERILLAYYKCVMDKGPCTKDGKNFKREYHRFLNVLVIYLIPYNYDLCVYYEASRGAEAQCVC